MIQKKDFQLNNNKNIKNEMFKNVHIAKLNMENIINNEINDEIIEAHESIIENCNNSNINWKNFFLIFVFLKSSIPLLINVILFFEILSFSSCIKYNNSGISLSICLIIVL